MADNTPFRPRKIDPSEFDETAGGPANLPPGLPMPTVSSPPQQRSEMFPPTPADGNEMLSRVQQMQGGSGQQFANEGGDPFSGGGMQKPQLSGPVPAAFRQYLDDGAQKGPQVRQARPHTNVSNMDYGGSGVVKGFIDGVKGIIENYEPVTLPSLGKFYDGNDGPTDGVLHIRTMTAKEEAILATPRHVKKGDAVNMIFKNCLMEKIDPDNLLTIDRTYLLIFLRGISYSPDYEVELRCTECGSQKFPYTINLDTLFVDHCPDDFGPDKMVGVLPKTGFGFRYRLSRGRDETQIAAHRERRIRQHGDSGNDDTLLYRASLLIEEMTNPNGGTLVGQTAILAVLEQLPIADAAYLRNLMSEPPFGVDTKCSIICPFCSCDFNADLPLEAGFFFPRTKKKKEIPA